ncbi:MAG TPA: DUF692 domain-containing protein [Arenimonas sp.]|nr:DUF692 domain-containing protein [Arenimonas sp.]
MMKSATGTGLGFRRELLPELRGGDLSGIGFFEVAPENWAGLGGRYGRDLRAFTERFPFVAHGLSLSIGSSDALDTGLLKQTKAFMAEHGIGLYTEHLSWCSHEGHLYDLLPIPCTEEAVHWVAGRIRQAQDILGMRIGMENASYYFAPPGAEMSEAEFISAIVREADCLLHLDVNNVYVNSRNFGFEPLAYLKSLPLDKVCYLHMAGHYAEPDGFLIDTHGAEIIDPVWDLLDVTYTLIGERAAVLPTCLERDYNFPPLADLLAELRRIRGMQQLHRTASRLSA